MTETCDWDWVPERDLDPLHEVAKDLLAAGRPSDFRVVMRAWKGLGGVDTIDAGPDGPPPDNGMRHQ